MPPKEKLHALLPVLNGSCVTFEGSSWWVAEDIQLGTLSEEDARLASEEPASAFQRSLEPGNPTFILGPLPDPPRQEPASANEAYVSRVALACQLAFSFVGQQTPLVIPCAMLLSSAGPRRLRAFHQFETWGDTARLRNSTYQLREGITVEDVTTLLHLAREALAAGRALAIPFRRYCSALIKTDPHDKLIDLTIALESLVPGGGEFRFRFPYFLSLLVSPGADDRHKAFEELQLLYDARSALVHGATEKDKLKDISQASALWDALVAHTRRCILYRMHFQATIATPWQNHLMDLSYGAEPLL